MDRDTAITIVRVLAALEWVGAAFGLLLGLLFAFGGPFLAGAVASEPTLAGIGADILAFVFIGLGVLFLILGIVSLVTGIGLWRLRNWGRILALITSWLSIAWSLVNLVGSVFSGTIGDALIGVISNLFGIAFAGMFVWLLQFNDDIVALFRQPATSGKPSVVAPAKRRK